MSTENAANYSDEAIASIIKAVTNGAEGSYKNKDNKVIEVKSSVFNFDVANVLAEQLGKKAQSIVAKVKSLEAQATNKSVEEHDAVKSGAWYQKKPDYVSKTGKDVVRKADLLEKIANDLDLGVETVQGSWNTKATIELVYNAIRDLTDEIKALSINEKEEGSE